MKWTTISGDKVDISELTDSALLGLSKFVIKISIKERKQSKELSSLLEEVLKRNLEFTDYLEKGVLEGLELR